MRNLLIILFVLSVYGCSEEFVKPVLHPIEPPKASNDFCDRHPERCPSHVK